MACDPPDHSIYAREKGWICPSCGRGVAPGVQTCDHGGPVDVGPYRPWPTIYPPAKAHPLPSFNIYERCRNGGVCMCVRPDRSVTMLAR